MAAKRTAAFLLVLLCPVVAEKSRIVRKSVSAEGEIMVDSQGRQGEMSVSATGEIQALSSDQPRISPSGDIIGASFVDENANAASMGEELLAQVESIFEKGKLDKQDARQINVIKDLVDKEILPDLQKTHDAAQDMINQNLERIKKCNANSSALQTTIKGNTEAATDTARTAHAECRTEEENKKNTKTGRCGELDAFLGTITVPANLPAARPRDAMVGYVSTMSSYFCPKGPEVEKLDDACTKAEKEHDEHQNACNRKQATFEVDFCIWKTELSNACTNLDTCYDDKVQMWKDHVTATKVLVEKWKTEFKALHKIKCFTDVWLNNNDKTTVDASQYDQCKNTEEDDSVMEVNEGTQPAKQTCDLKPVEIAPDSAEFPKAEYSKFLDFAVAPIPCLSTAAPAPADAPIAASITEAPTTAAPTTTTGEIEKRTSEGWQLVHECTHCGNRGSAWKSETQTAKSCQEKCDADGKQMLIYNHVYKNCRCYSDGDCHEDNLVKASSSSCTHNIFGK